MVLSLYAKGLTTAGISAHYAGICCASVSKETISPDHQQGDRGDAGLACAPAGYPVYAAVLIGAIAVKIRDGQIASRPAYAAIAVGLDGKRDILGLECGIGGEGARFWMAVTAGIKNRGTPGKASETMLNHRRGAWWWKQPGMMVIGSRGGSRW